MTLGLAGPQFETGDMPSAYVIRPSDRAMFKQCRRAWDLGSRSRQNYEPLSPSVAFDFDQAMHEALALYYFPGMWSWDREIVLPTVLDGFVRSMERQRTECHEARPLAEEEEDAWEADFELGKRMLEHYFLWAPTIDSFEPIRIASDFESNVADPSNAGQDLAVPGTTPPLPIRYRGRTDALVLDGYDAYWIVDHRIAGDDGFADLNQLLLDEEGAAACWALQNFDLGMKVQGVIYNELRKVAPDAISTPPPAKSVLTRHEAPVRPPPTGSRSLYKEPLRVPESRVEKHGNAYFRRTIVARSQVEIENVGRQIAREASEIASPEAHVYPNPAWRVCSTCQFLRPCLAISEGVDASAMLGAFYRKRPDDEFKPGRLGGSTWSIDRGSAPLNFGGKT